MKRLAFALSLVAATAFAAPLAAQGPWYDPTGTGQRTNQGRVDRNGNIYNGGVYQNGRYDVPADGRWYKMGTDRQGHTIYVRERYDSQGNLIQEAATRNWLGHYSVIDSRVVSYARNNGRYDRGTYGNNGRYDGTYGRDRNDRWDQNNGHDNGKHKGQYKNRNKGHDRDEDRGRGRHDD
jgi:hypothetical protein